MMTTDLVNHVSKLRYGRKVVMRGKGGVVLKDNDIDTLSGSINRTVRHDNKEDAEVKRLYNLYKKL